MEDETKPHTPVETDESVNWGPVYLAVGIVTLVTLGSLQLFSSYFGG